MSDLVAKLESWYSARCIPGNKNYHGFKIENVAEGGWWLRADLPEAERASFQSVLQPKEDSPDENPNSWIQYSLMDGAFIGTCAPNLLHELLSAFLSTAEASQRNEA